MAEMNQDRVMPERKIIADDWTLFILAGGRSRRIGRDKSRIQINGISLLARVKRLAQSCAPRTKTLRTDSIPNCGPLSGIYTGLIKTRTPWCLFLACDMPLLTSETLLNIVEQTGHRATPAFTETEHGFGFPLSLNKAHAGIVRKLIDEGKRSVFALSEAVRPAAFRVARNRGHELFNANTPADIQRLTEIISSRGS